MQVLNENGIENNLLHMYVPIRNIDASLGAEPHDKTLKIIKT